MRGLPIISLLSRYWILLVSLIVVIVSVAVVARLHRFFGAEERKSYADSNLDSGKPFSPKNLTYEVFGPPGTVAAISYYDVNAEPQLIDAAQLPWALRITTNLAALTGSIAVQGDASTIGCRIVVDDKIKAEQISTGYHAFTYCLVKAA